MQNQFNKPIIKTENVFIKTLAEKELLKKLKSEWKRHNKDAKKQQ
jgi:hypothetical protein